MCHRKHLAARARRCADVIPNNLHFVYTPTHRVAFNLHFEYILYGCFVFSGSGRSSYNIYRLIKYIQNAN